MGLCHGTGELKDNLSGYQCDLESRGDNEGESQPQAVLSWMKPLSNASSSQVSKDCLSRHTPQDSLSVDPASKGIVKQEISYDVWGLPSFY